MAVTATPIFVQAPRVAVQTLSVANANRDGSGTIATVWTAGANGSRIDHIDVAAYGTIGAGVIRLYVYDGATAHLWKELLCPATTPSATVATWMTSVDCSKPENLLVLPSGYSLRASTENGSGFKVHTFGGDF